jgi:hypothetical protein
MIKKWLSISMFVISQIALGQKGKTFIPFQLTAYNNIAVKAILNQKDTVQLMLHTGATDVTLTETAVKKLLTPIFDKTIDGIKSWGGTTDGARISNNNSLAIAGLKWDSLTIAENKNSGQFTDGKFGLDLFGDKFIEIDYDKKIIIVSDKLPKRLKDYEKHKLTYENGLLFLEADCTIENENNLANKFFLHSGFAGGILFDDKFANENQLSEKLKITGEKELKDSYGKILRTKKAILPVFKIGKNLLQDIPVSFFISDLGIQKVSAIGGDIIKRFNWIIDAKRNFVYIKPNSNFHISYLII